MNDIRMCALEQRSHIGTHRFCHALNGGVFVFVCVYVLSVQ